MRKIYLAAVLVFVSFLQLHAQTCQPSYASLPFSENFETSWQSLCGSNKGMPSIYWLNEFLTGNKSWRRNNEATTANWTYPTIGDNYYTGGANNTSYSARFHSPANPPSSTGSLSLTLIVLRASAQKN